ncbi:MAG TPA: pyridoxamine 5'-phosphate oxidase family protein [Actinomycetota bacterium]|nr:pyridoxamine 5'-phosphate oxidase family protein [Actinomycetota bacterium]
MPGTDPGGLRAVAASIVDGNRYMTLATADAHGRPWASPVWYAHTGFREFLWVSSPDATHSRNLATRPELSIVIFDSHRAGGWTSVYLAGVAEELVDVDDAIRTFSARSVAEGLPAWTRGDVLPPARHRLYRATITELWVLDPHDRRVAVDLG